VLTDLYTGSSGIDGVKGFRSQMSMVGGPPLIHIRMQDLLRAFSAAALACTCDRKFMAGSVAAAVAMCCMK